VVLARLESPRLDGCLGPLEAPERFDLVVWSDGLVALAGDRTVWLDLVPPAAVARLDARLDEAEVDERLRVPHALEIPSPEWFPLPIVEFDELDARAKAELLERALEGFPAVPWQPLRERVPGASFRGFPVGLLAGRGPGPPLPF